MAEEFVTVRVGRLMTAEATARCVAASLHDHGQRQVAETLVGVADVLYEEAKEVAKEHEANADAGRPA